MVEELMEALVIEQEIAAFEAKLADLDALDAAEFEAQLEEELANQAALAKFLANLLKRELLLLHQLLLIRPRLLMMPGLLKLRKI